MSPFYRKEGENLTEWKGEPLDFKVGGDKVSILPAEDKEQITIYTEGSVVGLVEAGHGLIFPGQEVTINRRGVIFENLATGERDVIVHSEKPLK